MVAEFAFGDEEARECEMMAAQLRADNAEEIAATIMKERDEALAEIERLRSALSAINFRIRHFARSEPVPDEFRGGSLHLLQDVANAVKAALSERETD